MTVYDWFPSGSQHSQIGRPPYVFNFGSPIHDI